MDFYHLIGPLVIYYQRWFDFLLKSFVKLMNMT